MNPSLIAQFEYSASHLFSALVLIGSFSMIYQRRMVGMFNAFAFQAIALACAAAWQAHIQAAHHLYVTAAMAFVLKGIIIPVALRMIVRKLDIHRSIEVVIGVGLTMLAGIGLVALAALLVLPVTADASAITREELALALSVVLIGLLIMISRRNAVTQVIGFMSMENGLILAAVGVAGMPLVVEMSVAFAVLVAFIIFGLFFFRIRERFDSLDVHYLESFRGDRR
jgi:hydrogenase-4 component E